jgi:pimeloyl-ACP methyl ester carboxylesterase
MSTITTSDGTEIHYKEWGKGPVVTFSHGWPLSSDAWDGQMLFLAQHGYRVVAHDRRGHGRSSQAASGNDMNGYADDLAALMEALDLRDVTLVGPRPEAEKSRDTSASTQRVAKSCFRCSAADHAQDARIQRGSP